jgi:hypothetical protein
LAHCFQAVFSQYFFYAGKQHIFFKADMIVQKLREMRHAFRLDRNFCRKLLLEIENGGANFRVIGEEPHYVGILIQPNLPGVRGQQHLFLFAKMHVPGFMPKAHKFPGMFFNKRRALFLWRFRRTPHLQRLDQREMVVLAKWMQADVAFHEVIATVCSIPRFNERRPGI